MNLETVWIVHHSTRSLLGGQRDSIYLGGGKIISETGKMILGVGRGLLARQKAAICLGGGR